jgi:hypothetical protein
VTPTSLPRRQTWLAALAIAGAAITAWSGRAPDAAPAPEKNEHRHVRLGPDSPDEALRYIKIAMRDEFGNIDPNGLMNARRQADAMRAQQLIRAQQAAAAGEPDAAGITSASWTWIGPGNIGGRTRGIAIHPTTTSTIFAGSVAGGIWKSTDGGVSWNIIDDFMTNLAVTAIVFQPGNPSVMYASTGEGFSNQDAIRGAGIFKSVNGGTTWSQLASTANSNFNFVTDLAMSADGSILLASTTTGLFKSLNGGGSFAASNLVTNVQDVKFLPGSNTNAVAGGRVKTAYFSTDGGSTWTVAPLLTGGGANMRVELGVSVSTPNVVYASVAAGGTASSPPAELWLSTDSGHNYTLKSTPTTSLLGAQGWYDNAIWVDPTNDQHVIVGGVFLFSSTDGGATFGLFAPGIHPDHHAIVNDPGYDGAANKRVYFFNDGGLYKIESLTASGTQTPTKLNNNYGVTQFYGGSSVTTGKIFGGTQDNGTLLYTPANGPQAWTTLQGGDGGFASGDQTDPNFMYGEFQWLQIHRNSTGGASSSVDISGCGSSKAAQYVISDCTNQTTNFISPILLDPNNPNRLLAGGNSLWRTDDARTATTSTTGPTWAVIKAAGSAIAALAFQPGNSDRIWVGHNNGDIYITNDGTGGAPTWTKVDLTPLTGGPPDRAVTQISLDPANPNVAYVSFGGFSAGNVWKTPDAGASWVNISGSGATALPSAPARSVVPHPSVAGWLYVGTDIGIFTSIDGGATWNIPNDGPANVAVFQLFWTGNTLVAVTHGRGMYTALVTPPTTPTITTQPVTQAVGIGGTATLSVAASGSTPLTYQWYQGATGVTTVPVAGATSSTFTPPAVFVTTSYWVRVTNGFGNVDSSAATLTPQAGIASYDSTLKAPRCTTVGSSCDTGVSAVLGRGTIAGGAEPNQPNTINNSCADTATGTFHGTSGESIDSVKISTLNNSLLSVGKTVKIDVSVWVVSPVTDRLDLYGAPAASSPVWTLIETLAPGALGQQTLTSSSYVLPAGGLQAIRAHFRSGGSASSCGTVAGQVDDHDDLIFAVSPALGVEMLANGTFTNGTVNWGLPANSGTAGTTASTGASAGWSAASKPRPAAVGPTELRVGTASTGSGPSAPDGPLIGGLRWADDGPSTGSTLAWQVEASTTRREILQWADPIDLGGATSAYLGFASAVSAVASSAEVQVSLDGVTWEPLMTVPPVSGWISTGAGLDGLLGRVFYLRFVFDAVAPGIGAPPDSWRLDNVSITTRGGG